MTRLQFETASNSKQLKLQFNGHELQEDEDNEAGDSEMGSEATNSRELVVKLQSKLATKEELLREAVIEFHNKNEEFNRIQQVNQLVAVGLGEQELANPSQMSKSWCCKLKLLDECAAAEAVGRTKRCESRHQSPTGEDEPAAR